MKDYKLEAEKICNSVEDIAKGHLNNKEDLLRITEIALQNHKMELLEDLAFHAKFLQGLVNIIQNRDNKIEEEYFAKVKSEMLQSIEKVQRLLSELLEFASDFLKTIYKEKYFQMSREAISNLNSLCSDLSYLKLYLNDVKRNPDSQ